MKEHIKPLIVGTITITIMFILPYIIWYQNEPFLISIFDIFIRVIFTLMISLVVGILIILIGLIGHLMIDIYKGVKKYIIRYKIKNKSYHE